MHYNEFKALLRQASSVILSGLSVLFWLLLIFAFDTPLLGMMTVISVIIHEFGHEIYLYLRTGRLCGIRGVLNGLKLPCDEISRFSYKEEALLYASGPLANILVAVIYPIYSSLGEFAEYFALINVTTAASNLIPIKGYDGYGVLYAALRAFFPFEAAGRACGSISCAFTVALCIISLYFIDRFGESYWIFFVFSVSLISSMAQSLKNTN